MPLVSLKPPSPKNTSYVENGDGAKRGKGKHSLLIYKWMFGISIRSLYLSCKLNKYFICHFIMWDCISNSKDKVDNI